MEADLQDVVDELSRLLGTAAVLEDRAFHLVAFGSQPATVDAVRRTSILQRESSPAVRAWFEQFGIATSSEPVRTPGNDELGIAPRLCLPARSGGLTHGYLWVLDEDLGALDERLPAAVQLAGRAGRLLARSARERQARAELLVELLGDDRSAAASAAADLVDAGLVGGAEPVGVVAVRRTTGLDAEREPVPVRAGQLPGVVLTAGWRGHTVLLVPLRHATGDQPLHEAAAGALAAAPDAVAGLGTARPSLAQAHESWAEARLAARVAAALPSRRPVAAYAALGAYRLLGAAAEPALSAAVLDDAVRALLAEPDDRLATTARSYLDHAGSVQDTAAALQVHRQTLYYRLQRIEQVTGLDLGRGEDRLRLHLGLLLGPLLPPRP